MKGNFTPQEKKVAQKIALKLVTIIKLYNSVPPSRNKEAKLWEHGFDDGAKHMVTNLAYMIRDDGFTERIDKLLEIEEDNDRLFRKKNWAQIKKPQQEVKARKLKTKRSSADLGKMSTK